MDRSNTNNLLIGANPNNYYYSTNGGITWQHWKINSSYGNVGDPCVLVDSTGNFYYFHLVNDLSRVVCQKTTSLGGVWSNGSFTGVNGTKDDDKDWAVLDWKTNNIYAVWSQFDIHGSTNPRDSSEIQFSRSTDQGLSWSKVVRVSKRNGNAQGGNYSCHCPMPAIGPNNDVYVTWMGPEGLMFDISHDAGVTWLADDIKAYPHHINWLTFNIPGVQRTPGFPVVNCDLSPGPNYGNIYICWADEFNGSNDTDVWFIKSTDGGITWSSRIRVNDDPPGKHQFFPWMTIDQVNGYLYFVFYDRRNYTDSNTDVYLAISTDGGNTFVNTKLSESPFTPLQNIFIGDYIGITAHNNIV
ncbi:MAG: glycosyl hydrolase, partial [Methanococcaceae archaeon]